MNARRQQESERVNTLEKLSAQVQQLTLDLLAARRGYRDKPKWAWPAGAMEIVEKLRKLGKDNNEYLRQKLDPLLEWPNKESADPELFYTSAPPFDRKKDWFENTMGFDKYQTPYTFTDRWDRVEIKATFLVPKDLEPGDKCPIIWYFHGGGYCTGASDHIPWYSKASLEHAKRHKAIIIAPDYPLGPEATYLDIGNSINEFLKFYNSNGCFEEGEDQWTQWLAKKIGKVITLETDQILVEGESAGGHAAVAAMWLNAQVSLGLDMEISAALLRYPMVAHYERDFPANGEGLVYMGHTVSQQEAKKQAEAIMKAIEELEKFGLVPTRTTGLAPQYMAPAFLLSTTKLWERAFSRYHKLEVEKYIHEIECNDCLEFAENWRNIVWRMSLPPIVMYHGHDDINCPYENTEEFKNILTDRYPGRYVDNKTIFLEKVTELFEKNGVKGNHSTEVGHGFDYALSEEQEPFLKRAYERVDKFWPVPRK